MYPETWKNSRYITFRYEKCCSCHRTASVGLRRDSYLGNWAICTHGVTKVDVNKQTALFYECKGRRTISRDEYNEQENPFPILHLKLADTTHMLAVWENKKQFLDAAVAG